MSRSVSDAAAIGFAAGFYGSLGDGMSVGEAFDLGKVQIMLDGGDEQRTPRLKPRLERHRERAILSASNVIACRLREAELHLRRARGPMLRRLGRFAVWES